MHQATALPRRTATGSVLFTRPMRRPFTDMNVLQALAASASQQKVTPSLPASLNDWYAYADEQNHYQQHPAGTSTHREHQLGGVHAAMHAARVRCSVNSPTGVYEVAIDDDEDYNADDIHLTME
ncbi:hypothetical protein Vretimale_17340 [Volvox reticuliferus]|uniref:Uncharacterized protein n=1 Tax=Volvox reticuliferus TaxID=1737510 RepID=A0A8J4BXC2_9CHLO|nr:hypothetical protein Vretifemale_75 [Volvox reticuliferus]GIM14389.1 hypothetical protein Vretimale_17340 [Volvox reticuliferus]